MEPVEATLALLQLVNDYRCAVYAECQFEATAVAPTPTTPRLPVRAAVEVTVSSTSGTGATVELQGVEAKGDTGSVNVRSAG